MVVSNVLQQRQLVNGGSRYCADIVSFEFIFILSYFMATVNMHFLLLSFVRGFLREF